VDDNYQREMAATTKSQLDKVGASEEMKSAMVQFWPSKCKSVCKVNIKKKREVERG